MAHYETGLACLNGHAVNSSADTSPERNAKYCPDCGEATICHCPNCKAAVRGDYHVEGVSAIGFAWRPDSHCHQCGEPYPWTQRRAEALAEAIDELDQLGDDERERLKRSIPDILSQTPKSETAVLRFKKALTKVGAAGAKFITDLLSQVAADAVKKQLGL